MNWCHRNDWYNKQTQMYGGSTKTDTLILNQNRFINILRQGSIDRELSPFTLGQAMIQSPGPLHFVSILAPDPHRLCCLQRDCEKGTPAASKLCPGNRVHHIPSQSYDQNPNIITAASEKAERWSPVAYKLGKENTSFSATLYESMKLLYDWYLTEYYQTTSVVTASLY